MSTNTTLAAEHGMGDHIVTVRGATSEIQDKGRLHTNHLPLSHVHMKCFSAALKITDESERLVLQCRGRVHAVSVRYYW